MDKLYLEEPSIKRKNAAIEYIKEHNSYSSNMNGSAGLKNYINNYEEWLQKLEKNKIMNERDHVPSHTYFVVRKNDDRIIGMINIRLGLTEELKKIGGNIGYGIRPTERRKGYNKINLYLALLICKEHGLKKVLLDADINNPASWKTMESLGGVRIKEKYNEELNSIKVDYEINVNKTLKDYSYLEEYIYKKEVSMLKRR